jgi:hypothetical protein
MVSSTVAEREHFAMLSFLFSISWLCSEGDAPAGGHVVFWKSFSLRVHKSLFSSRGILNELLLALSIVLEGSFEVQQQVVEFSPPEDDVPRA